MKNLHEAWLLNTEAVLEKSNVDPNLGLSQNQAQNRLLEDGANKLQSFGKQSKFLIFAKQFKNPMVYMLLAAAILAIFLKEFLDAIAITFTLLLNAVIGYIQEAKASDAISALKKLSVPKAKVIREGLINNIPSDDIVRGDIIQLEAGDYVSADARIIESWQLSSDEASLTGESLPVNKNSNALSGTPFVGDRINMLHSGTAITTGTCKAIVTSTGMYTEIGKIAGMLNTAEVEITPLQKRLEQFTHKLILLGFILIGLVIVIRYIEGDSWFLILMSAISLAVAAIPEGLPTVVTIALALAVRRMTKANAIIRHIASVETLGSTNVICTDKTGTLTTGIMSVRNTFLFDPNLEAVFIQAMILCNNSSIEGMESGDPTEVALLRYAFDKGFSIKDIRKRVQKLHEWSFDSDRKRMSVLVNQNGKEILFVKGASETILERSLMSDDNKNTIKNLVHEWSSRGERLLAVAMKEGHFFGEADEVEKNLTFLGLVSIADPPKPETIKAVEECQLAGIKVMMITGDHPVTAKAIAKELGISKSNDMDDVLSGTDLEKAPLEELKTKVEKITVFARVSPLHKLKIVEALQSNGHIVSMTGDGVNDAPALKKAQIGVAMGKSGTEVARKSSSMILTDDNFSTIVKAIEEGRAIFGNIKRTIQYLLSTNLALVLVVLGSSIISLPVPYTPISLLWINLVTDGMPSLALAAEPLEENFLSKSRRPSPGTFFDPSFIREMVLTGTLMTLINLGIYFYLLDFHSELYARSIAFNLIVFTCLFRSFSCRSDTLTFFEMKFNPYYLASIFVPLLLQFGMQFSPFILKVFNVEALEVGTMIYLCLIGLILPILVDSLKFLRRKRLSSRRN